MPCGTGPSIFLFLNCGLAEVCAGCNLLVGFGSDGACSDAPDLVGETFLCRLLEIVEELAELLSGEGVCGVEGPLPAWAVLATQCCLYF